MEWTQDIDDVAEDVGGVAKGDVEGHVEGNVPGNGAPRDSGYGGTDAQFLRRVQAETVRRVPDERAPLLADIGRAVTASGGRALVVGEPGLGKTTVLAQVVDRARTVGTRVLQARTSETGVTTPFLGLVDLCNGVTDDELAGLPDVQREALEVALNRRRPGDVLPLTAVELALVGLLSRLQQKRPVLVAVDDWHWLDEETTSLLTYVFTRPPDHAGPALLATQCADSALSGRTLPVDRALFPAPVVHTLQPLSLPALGAVLTDLRGVPVPADVLQRVFTASGGNPLWALELLDGQDTSPGTSSDPHLPGSVADTVMARVRELPDPERQVLAAIAAMGAGPAGRVLALAGQDAAALVGAIEHGVVAERKGLLAPAHQLMGAAALLAVGRPRRMQLHAQVAAATSSPAERAWHLDRSVLPGPDEHVAAALDAAYQDSRRHGATASALAQAERALLRSSPESPRRQERVLAVAEAAVAAASFSRASAVLQELDLARLDCPLLDRALPLVADSVTAESGDASLRALLEELAARTTPETVNRAMIEVRAVGDGDPVPDRQRRAEHALRLLADRPDLPASQHQALMVLLTARLDAGGGLDRGLLDRMRRLEPDLGVLAVTDSADALFGFHAYQVDQLADSRRALVDLLARADAMGDELIAGVFGVHLAVVELLAGDTDRARELLARFDEVDPWRSAPPPVVVRARGLLAIADGDTAQLEELLDTASGPGGPISGELMRSAVRGIAAARNEQWSQAAPALERAWRLAEEMGRIEPGRRVWLDAELGPVLVALDRPADAERLADRLRDLAKGGRALVSSHEARLRGLLAAARGDLQAAVEHLEAAAAGFRATGFVGDLGRCQLDLGRVLRRRRARAAALRALTEAAALAADIHDGPLAVLTGRELTGRRTRSPGELTQAERRVAEAAAAGLSNREIATAEFVSVRTVEAQLASAYRKLGVHSRTQLAARIRPGNR